LLPEELLTELFHQLPNYEHNEAKIFTKSHMNCEQKFKCDFIEALIPQSHISEPRLCKGGFRFNLERHFQISPIA
jgi:hypothetical protein